jgi:hypothetical protein
VRQPDGRFATFDDGAVTDINNRGQVVGQTLDAAGQTIGFLRDPDGKLTIIDLPGRAEVGEVLALNDRGQVAGLWEDRAETPTVEPGTHHGFVWDRGRLAKFDVPGSLGTGAHQQRRPDHRRLRRRRGPPPRVRAAAGPLHHHRRARPDGHRRLGHQRPRRDRHPRLG